MKLKLIRLKDGSDRTVICEGHVDRAEFAKHVDTDDVADILGDGFEGLDCYPSPADESAIAAMARHSWGVWSQEGKHRRWDEVHKDVPGAAPFTVLDQEGVPALPRKNGVGE